jgi:hypothetical protein
MAQARKPCLATHVDWSCSCTISHSTKACDFCGKRRQCVATYLCEEHIDLVEQRACDEAGKEHNDDLHTSRKSGMMWSLFTQAREGMQASTAAQPVERGTGPQFKQVLRQSVSSMLAQARCLLG